MNIQTYSLGLILDNYMGRVLSVQAGRQTTAAARYTGAQPSALIASVLDQYRRDGKDASGVLALIARDGYGDWTTWYAHQNGSAQTAPVWSASAAGPVFVTPTRGADGYGAGHAVLLVCGARGLRRDLTIGGELGAAAGLRQATRDEVVDTLAAWAAQAGFRPRLEWTGSQLLDAWSEYSARAAGAAFGVEEAPEATPAASASSIADDIEKAGLPAGLTALLKTLAATLGAGVVTPAAAPAPRRHVDRTGPLPALPGLSVVVPTISHGSFRSGSPVLVIGAANGGGDYLVWDGSRIVRSPDGARSEHVRPASRDEARSFLASFVARVAAAAVAA